MCEHCIDHEDCKCNSCKFLNISWPVYCRECHDLVYVESDIIKMAKNNKKYHGNIKDNLQSLMDYYYDLMDTEKQLEQYKKRVAIYVMIKGLSFRNERDEAWEYYGIRKMNRKVYRATKKEAYRILLRILSIRRNIETYQYNIKEEVEKLKEVRTMMDIFGYKEISGDENDE